MRHNRRGENALSVYISPFVWALIDLWNLTPWPIVRSVPNTRKDSTASIPAVNASPTNQMPTPKTHVSTPSNVEQEAPSPIGELKNSTQVSEQHQRSTNDPNPRQ
jgi:hypothetical protein